MQRAKHSSPVYARIREILESARVNLARTVNSTQVVANWLIGREIVEEQQRGADRAEYGKHLMETLSKRLGKDYGAGYSLQSLFYIKQFYLGYPELLPQAAILHGARGKFAPDSARSQVAISHAPRQESWQPGQLHPSLSWTHYRTLLRVDKPEARDPEQ